MSLLMKVGARRSLLTREFCLAMRVECVVYTELATHVVDVVRAYPPDTVRDRIEANPFGRPVWAPRVFARSRDLEDALLVVQRALGPAQALDSARVHGWSR